jgi:hypothetical protein
VALAKFDRLSELNRKTRHNVIATQILSQHEPGSQARREQIDLLVQDDTFKLHTPNAEVPKGSAIFYEIMMDLPPGKSFLFTWQRARVTGPNQLAALTTARSAAAISASRKAALRGPIQYVLIA